MREVKKKLLLCLYLSSESNSKEFRASHLSYQQLYAFLPFQEPSIRGAVTQLRAAGFCSAYQRGGQTIISLTVQGRELVYELFPAFSFTNLRYDGMWTVIIFHTNSSLIQEFRKTRELLTEHGFFPVHDGVYVKPGRLTQTMRSQLRSLPTFPFLTAFETKEFIMGSADHLLTSLLPWPVIEKHVEHFEDNLAKFEKALKGRYVSLHKQRKYVLLALDQLLIIGSLLWNIPESYVPQNMRLNYLITTYTAALKTALLQE